MHIRKPIILVDLDDTINDFSNTYWNVYNDKFNEDLDPQTVDSWNLQKYVREDIDAYELLKHPGLFRNLPLKDYAYDFMKRIHDLYNVYIVTDSPSGTSDCEIKNGIFSNPADDKRRWVEEYLPFFPQDKIIMCSHKWMVEGDILVDDKPGTFEKFTELGKHCILIDMPYNRHIETKYRVKNLREAEKMIEEILSAKKESVGTAMD